MRTGNKKFLIVLAGAMVGMALGCPPGDDDDNDTSSSSGGNTTTSSGTATSNTVTSTTATSGTATSGTATSQTVTSGTVTSGTVTSGTATSATATSTAATSSTATSAVQQSDGGFPVLRPDGSVIPDGSVGTFMSGVVRRTVDKLGTGKDGKGTLCVALTDKCPDVNSVTNPPVGFVATMIQNVDVSNPATNVPFQLDATGIPNGSYVVSGYLSETGGDCSGSPQAGDIVTFVNPMAPGTVPCPAVELVAGQDVDNLVMNLNFVMISLK